MKIILAAALIAAAPLAVAAAPITASPAVACAAAAVPPPAEPTSSAALANTSGEGTATTERLRGGRLGDTSDKTADQQGRRDSQVSVVVARSCI